MASRTTVVPLVAGDSGDRLVSQATAARLLGLSWARVNELRLAGTLKSAQTELGWCFYLRDVEREAARREAERLARLAHQDERAAAKREAYHAARRGRPPTKQHEQARQQTEDDPMETNTTTTTNDHDDNRTVTQVQACRMLDLSYAGVFTAIKAGVLRARHDDLRGWLIVRADVERELAARKARRAAARAESAARRRGKATD